MNMTNAIAVISCILLLAVAMMAGCTGISQPAVTTGPSDGSTTIPVAPGTAPATSAPTLSPVMASQNEETKLDINTLYVNSTSSGRIVTIANGDRILVRLNENPTTGYVWNATVPKGISIISDTYVAPGTQLMGAPGYHEWILEPQAVDTYTFTAEYRRPWETTGPAAETFQLVIQVTKE